VHSRLRYASLAVAVLAAFAFRFWIHSIGTRIVDNASPRFITQVPRGERRPPARTASPAVKAASPEPSPVARTQPVGNAGPRSQGTAARPPAVPLQNPPEIVRAVYITSWSAGIPSRIDYLIDLHKTTEINAAVIDIKDYSGYIAYQTAVPWAAEYRATRVTVRDIDALVSRLHKEGIYAIARITVFQDPILAHTRPDLAVHRQSLLGKGERAPLSRDSLWLDRKGLAWIDPASRPAWDYIAAIAKDAAAHGFDEINFDYVRFPSDGDLNDVYYPSWDGKTPKHAVLKKFFSYLRQQLPGVKLSVDLFGLSTVNEDELGIGQIIEDAYASFDAVCPMVYPSHFARNFRGYPNPAEHPYEVVNYAIRHAAERLDRFNDPPAASATANVAAVKPHADSTPAPAAATAGTPQPPSDARQNHPASNVKLRPWLQDFNLGAKYDAKMVEAEIKAVKDAMGEHYAGYMIWNPTNVYTRDALKPAAKP